MSVDTMARLAKIANIVGVKDATASMTRVTQQRAACGPDFVQISGEDGTALGFNAHGGVGCISVTSNIAPHLCSEFQEACLKGDFLAARELQDRLMPLHDVLFCETSPVPVKYAASLLGICEEECRLPLAPLTETSKARVRAAMTKAGLLN
jgi:4-hydroxy-tetrahydrodipicolinate synthase